MSIDPEALQRWTGRKETMSALDEFCKLHQDYCNSECYLPCDCGADNAAKELSDLRAENEIFRKEAELPSEFYRQQNKSLQEQLKHDAKEYIAMQTNMKEATDMIKFIIKYYDETVDGLWVQNAITNLAKWGYK
jgi:dsDNA-specific endonuclease/ATPase MutS2